MSTTAERIPDQAIEQAKRADLLALAERHTQLKKNAHRDWQGACPKCGGSNRFHVFQSASDGGEWRWRCYQCHEKPADAIALARWLQPAMSFADAVSWLTGTLPPAATAPARRQPERKQQPAQPIGWRERAERMVTDAHERLWRPEGEQGRAYLERRHLEPQTWLTYGVGYRSEAAVPGTGGKERAPALVLPWYAGGKLVAVRYRFLAPRGDAKITAEGGSQFAGRLFGGQALPRFAPAVEQPTERLRTLVIVEGEINGMSIWQCAGGPDMPFDWGIDVLSLGSESAKLSPAMVQFALRYGAVLAWADRAEVARELAAALPGAHPIRSPGGKDANDLLQEGLLGGFLMTVRADVAKSMRELEGLLWALWDTANTLRGLDTGSAQVALSLAAKLGKQVKLVEVEPDRWITAERAGNA